MFFYAHVQNRSLSRLRLAFRKRPLSFNPIDHLLDALDCNIWRRYDPLSVNSQQLHQDLLQEREHIQQLHFHWVTGSVSQQPRSSGCQRSSHDILKDCRNPSYSFHAFILFLHNRDLKCCSWECTWVNYVIILHKLELGKKKNRKKPQNIAVVILSQSDSLSSA